LRGHKSETLSLGRRNQYDKDRRCKSAAKKEKKTPPPTTTPEEPRKKRPSQVASALFHGGGGGGGGGGSRQPLEGGGTTIAGNRSLSDSSTSTSTRLLEQQQQERTNVRQEDANSANSGADIDHLEKQQDDEKYNTTASPSRALLPSTTTLKGEITRQNSLCAQLVVYGMIPLYYS
jgi:hypothetical protein